MTLSEIISNIDDHNDEAIIFAKKIDGKFVPSSEAVLVIPDDEEQALRTIEIADKYCSGFDYFLEVSLVTDMIGDLRTTIGYNSLGQQIDRIIHYAEFDA